jgi:hypothetical protein
LNLFLFLLIKSITTCDQHDYAISDKAKKSTDCGGVLGKLKAYVGSSEYTNWGGLHGHFLLWLLNGLNPTQVHEKINSDMGFFDKLAKFFDSIIATGIPKSSASSNNQNDPHTSQMPSALEFQSNPNLWCDEVSTCVEKLQRHVCCAVCHKYGSSEC